MQASGLFFVGCLGFHFGRLNLVRYTFFLGYNYGISILGHEQRSGCPPPYWSWCFQWTCCPPRGPKTVGIYWWICHFVPYFDGCYVNWFCWSYCCGLYYHLWYLSGNHFESIFSLVFWLAKSNRKRILFKLWPQKKFQNWIALALEIALIRIEDFFENCNKPLELATATATVNKMQIFLAVFEVCEFARENIAHCYL